MMMDTGGIIANNPCWIASEFVVAVRQGKTSMSGSTISGYVLLSIVRPRILGIIPARFASSRFPGKALATIAGKPMLQHVYERASQARYLSKVIIATDDERIHKAARAFGAQVMMTRADHLSGTDRVAEAAPS